MNRKIWPDLRKRDLFLATTLVFVIGTMCASMFFHTKIQIGEQAYNTGNYFKTWFAR